MRWMGPWKKVHGNVRYLPRISRSRTRTSECRQSVLRLNANTQFSPWISLVNNLQYDTVSRVLGLQSRFRWILRPGNDIHLVYAQHWLEDIFTGRRTLDRTAATKLVYTHHF